MECGPSLYPPSGGFRRHRLRRAVQAGIVAVTLACVAAPGLTAQAGPASDPTLVDRLRNAVLATSGLVAARRAELAATEARSRAAGAAPPAVLVAEIEEVPDALDVTEAGSVRLELSREFLTGGRRGARRDVASAEVREAAARVQLTERQVGARVEQLLTRALGQAAIAARLAAEDSLLSDVEDALRARFAVGDARYVDVLRLRTERLRVQTDLTVALTDARGSQRALLALAGLSESTTVVRRLADSLLASPAVVLDHALPPTPSLDSLLALSGAAQLADAAFARAEATARLRRAELRPALSAGLGLQRFGGNGDGFQVGPTLGVAISLPFTSAGGNRATREVTTLLVDAARLQREATLTTLQTELAAARDRYETARERLAVFDAALLRGAHEERESAFSAYRTGELSLLELLDFERALTRTEIVRLESRIAAVDAYADLIAGAAGEPTDLPTPVTLDGAGTE